MKACVLMNNLYNKVMISNQSWDESVLIWKMLWSQSHYFLVSCFWWNQDCLGAVSSTKKSSSSSKSVRAWIPLIFSLAIHAFQPLLLVSPLNGSQCLHRISECKFLLLYLCVGVHWRTSQWACLYFSRYGQLVLLCMDTGFRLENLLRVITGRDGIQERVMGISAVHALWWLWDTDNLLVFFHTW